MRTGNSHRAFTQIPNLVFELGLSHYALVVLICLIRAQGQDKAECYPSQKYLQKQCDASRHTIVRAINELVFRGLLTKKQGRAMKGGWTFNIYSVTDLWDLNDNYWATPRDQRDDMTRILFTPDGFIAGTF
jgi:predicted transcriptional regulator